MRVDKEARDEDGKIATDGDTSADCQGQQDFSRSFLDPGLCCLLTLQSHNTAFRTISGIYICNPSFQILRCSIRSTTNMEVCATEIKPRQLLLAMIGMTMKGHPRHHCHESAANANELDAATLVV